MAKVIYLKQPDQQCELQRSMVGAAGFELATPCAQGRCATRLRYAPTFPCVRCIITWRAKCNYSSLVLKILLKTLSF